MLVCGCDRGDGGVELFDGLLKRSLLRNVFIEAALLVGDLLQFNLLNVMGECCMSWWSLLIVLSV